MIHACRSLVSTDSRRRQPRSGHRFGMGQATVEFALVSIVFFMMVFGALDIGRAVFMYSELTNSVREGARVAEITPTNTTSIDNRVIQKSPYLGLTTSDITVSCASSCASGTDVTVSAKMSFQFITQQFLGIKPFTMHASATNAVD